MKPGTYIRQYLLMYKGIPLYRHGIVLRMISENTTPPIAEVLFFPQEQLGEANHSYMMLRNYSKVNLYVETIRLEIIEILAEPQTME